MKLVFCGHSRLCRAHPGALLAAGHEVALVSRSPTGPWVARSSSPRRLSNKPPSPRLAVTQPEKIRANVRIPRTA